MFQIYAEHQRMVVRDHRYPLERGASVGWALYLRRTFPMLQQVISRMRISLLRIDPGMSFSVKDSTFTLTSGYKYQFGQCQHKSDWENYLSNEYTIICFDELVAFEEEQYDQISGRCRTTDPVLRPMKKIRAMSNPLMRREEAGREVVSDPHWVRRRFVDPAPMGRVTISKEIKMSDGSIEDYTSIYLPAKLRDNPDKEFVKDYEKTLRSKPKHIVRAMLDGDWYAVAGGHYEECWSPDIHVCRPFRIPDDWPQFRAMDWGFKTWGTIGFFALDEDDNLFMHRELNFRLQDAKVVGKRLKAQEQKLGLWAGGRSRITGPADTQLWEQRGNVGRSKAAEFAALGISWEKADKKSRAANAARITQRLSDHSNRTTTPGIVIFSSCHEMIKCIPQMQTSGDNPEEPAKNPNDHWHDMMMYACAFASNGSKSIPMRSKHKKSRSGDDTMRERGQHGYGGTL